MEDLGGGTDSFLGGLIYGTAEREGQSRVQRIFREQDQTARAAPGRPFGRPRRRPAIAALAVLVVVPALSDTAPGAASDPAIPAAEAHSPAPPEEPLWIQNVELRVVRNPSEDDAPVSPGMTEAGGIDEVDCERELGRIGEAFDSADFQSLLLVGTEWDTAFTLDLATGEVLAYPRAAVVTPEGQLLRPAVETGFFVATFTAHEDGRITFADAADAYTVEPLPPLVGLISTQELCRRLPFYLRRAQSYCPDPAVIARLAGIGDDVNVVAFFGTWCQTCKQYLPALLRTVDETGNPHISVTLIGMDEDLIEPADWIANCGVSYTPTFVVRIGEEEIGRIVEEPRVSMEADLAEILLSGSGPR